MLLMLVAAIISWDTALFIVALRRAPDGYEDVDGFHYGLPPDPAAIFT